MDGVADPSVSSTISYNLGFHDVFLSFRGPDTRKTFAGHLYAALQRKTIFTFMDSEKLEKGSAILLLLEAIEMSKLSIVIFSKDYAFSTWCLIELAKIMECMDTKKQRVVPVFYEVEPSEIRYQTGRFKEAFDKHEQDGRESPEDLQRWRSALTKAATLSGWDSRIFQDDTKFIELIVDDVFEKMKLRSSSISGWNYDVFLNFRGADTRKGFVSHLYTALRRKSISPFVDIVVLKTGDTIFDEVMKAIEESKISVVVFSRNFASSTYCLKELDKSMEMKDKKKQIVMPIFYEVHPYEVRKQLGGFGDAFEMLARRGSDSDEVQRWRDALRDAAELSGWLSNEYKEDAKLIEDVTERIYETLIKSRSSRSINQIDMNNDSGGV